MTHGATCTTVGQVSLSMPVSTCSNIYRYVVAVGVSEISKDQAIKMVNTSVPIPGNEENYIIELDIWHQLHCLVRQDHSHTFP